MSETHGSPAPGWVHRRQRRADLDGVPAEELLTHGAGLTASLRLGRLGAEVWALGDFPEAAGPAADGATGPDDLAEVVESALTESGLPWRAGEGGWVIPAGHELPRPVTVRPADGGVEVGCCLADTLTEPAAVARFLTRAQFGLRFCRAELADGAVRLTGRVPAAWLARADWGAVGHAVGGVAAGARLLAREVVALATPAAARAFLAFHGNADPACP